MMMNLILDTEISLHVILCGISTIDYVYIFVLFLCNFHFSCPVWSKQVLH